MLTKCTTFLPSAWTKYASVQLTKHTNFFDQIYTNYIYIRKTKASKKYLTDATAGKTGAKTK
jgi:hypothetical protein